MKKLNFTAEKNYSRADIFISDNLADYTRSFVKKLFENGNVLIDGENVKPSKPILCGCAAEVSLPDADEYFAKPEKIPIDIIYEDDDIAVVNKPQGMTVHAGNGNTEGTLVNALLYNLGSLSGINGVLRPGIVHRIDKDTSGLLVVAKNDKAHLSLSAQIEKKICRRTYLALLEGRLKDEEGRITTYIGRHPQDRVKMAVVEPDKGKLAITAYKVLKRYEEGYTLCRFDLHTGRTHQIRVHAKYIGHPIVGDKTYGVKKQKFNLEGQLLHAWRLSLIHPSTGEEMSFEAPIPEYYEAILKKLKEI